MRGDLSTVDLQTGVSEETVSACEDWSEGSVERVRLSSSIRRFGQVAGMVFAMAASPATTTPDNWLLDRRRRDAYVVTMAFEGAVGRPITIRKAREIALRLLHEIEQDRMRVAEIDAQRTIGWENIV